MEQLLDSFINKFNDIYMKLMCLFLIIIAVVVLGVLFLYNSGLNERECSVKGDYCIYGDIPPSMIGSDPAKSYVEMQEGKEINEGDVSQYLIIDYSKNTMTCTSTGEPSKEIKYFYQTCADVPEGYFGCGWEMKALICGDKYFVEDFTSTYGPRLYGPFDYNN